MRRFLIWLSGARHDVLAFCPGDRPKYEGVGGAILITSAIAAVSMTFALNTALNVFLPFAMLGGAGWSLVIMTLDRWLVVSIQRRAGLGQNLLVALPRLALAVLLGAVISTPLVLQIFRPEIEAQIVQMQQNSLDSFQHQQQSGVLGKKISTLRTEVSGDQNIIASGGDKPQNAETDPVVVGLRAQLTQQQGTSAKDYQQWQCQLYGPCKPTGQGPLATADQQAYQRDQSQIGLLTGQIEARKRQLTSNDSASRATRVAQAKSDLPGAQSQLNTVTAQESALEKAYNAKNLGSRGLLTRLKALDQISAHDGTLNTARLVLLLLFTAIECLPVLVKLLLTFSPEDNYERIKARMEQAELANAEIVIQEGRLQTTSDVQPLLERIWSPPGDPDLTKTKKLPDEPDEPNEAGGEHMGDPGFDPWTDTQLRNMADEHVRGHSEGSAGYDDFYASAPPHPHAGSWPDQPLTFEDDD